MARTSFSLKKKATRQGIQGKLRVFHVLTEVFSTIYDFIQTSALIPSGCFELSVFDKLFGSLDAYC